MPGANTVWNGNNQAKISTAMPDVDEVVSEAAEIAARRGMPLQHPMLKNGALAALASTQLAPAPVDILQTLRGIETPMQKVESRIESFITGPVKLVADLASHTLGAGGKRLRPALALLSAQLCGDDSQNPNHRTVMCAAIAELMHTAALIHDDVVDGAATRRGKPAANLVWGNETSVLVGDYLLAQVFVAIARPEYSDLTPVIAQASSQLCAGELLETQTRGYLQMEERQYFDIIALKTAALTECACRLGAMAVGVTDERMERLTRFGREVGMAFQIVDDVFDVAATESRIGKPVGNDIREGDITLPMLRAMQTVSENERAELQNIIGSDPIGDDEVNRALEIIRASDALEYSLGVAAQYVHSAKEQLEIFADHPAKAMLADIADYVLARDK
jgi:geranylgeranyl pyrophosphate synthase